LISFPIFIEDTPSESIIDDIFKAWTEFEKEEQKTKEVEEKLKQEKETKGKHSIILIKFYEIL